MQALSLCSDQHLSLEAFVYADVRVILLQYYFFVTLNLFSENLTFGLFRISIFLIDQIIFT